MYDALSGRYLDGFDIISAGPVSNGIRGVSGDSWHSPTAKQDTDLSELKEINVSPGCYC